jgi:outer membrane protein assembly factor BamB
MRHIMIRIGTHLTASPRTRPTLRHLPTLLAPFMLLTATTACAEDWPQFRGPTGQGHYAGKRLPVEWSATKNIAWKQEIAGKGWSSPIVQNGRIYVTTAVPVSGCKTKDQSLQAICLDASTGKQVWHTEVFLQDGKTAPPIHAKNSHASPTPLTDGRRLFVHFGHQGTACLDLDGNVLWRNTDLRYKPVHGNGGTPIRVDDRLIFSVDGSDAQFVVALDCASGNVIWKTDRKCEAFKRFSFSTPLSIAVDGKQQVISPGTDAVIAYDPATGQELWRAGFDGYSLIPRPVFGHGMVFLGTGYERPTIMAVRANGSGDVTKSHVLWSSTKAAPHAPSPLLVGDELYTISDLGVAGCFDARTGKVHWLERLDGGFSASPMFAGGKIYLQSEEGIGTVLQAGKKFAVPATNNIGERSLASYAAVDGAIYLRTERHLYCIRQK